MQNDSISNTRKTHLHAELELENLAITTFQSFVNSAAGLQNCGSPPRTLLTAAAPKSATFQHERSNESQTARTKQHAAYESLKQGGHRRVPLRRLETAQVQVDIYHNSR